MNLIKRYYYNSLCYLKCKNRVVFKVFLYLLIGLLPSIFFSATSAEKTGKDTVPEKLSKTEVASHPRLIRHQADGSLILRAKYGRGIGLKIEYMPKWQAYGWFDATSRVEWDVEVEHSGDYEVHLEWSVSDEEAGKPFIFTSKDQELTGTVQPTGSWETFKTEKVGEIHLSSGIHEMIFKPGSDFEEGGALLDLRGVWLIPKK